MTISVTVSSAHIDAALQAVSKEETRYYLQGVFLDGRGFIAATNGHIAFAARCTDAIDLRDVRPERLSDALPGVIVPTGALLQASKAAGRAKGLSYVFERDNAGLWWILYGSARIHFGPVDGTFPDWQRIIPTAPETETAAHYQPQYVQALGNMAKALRNNKKGDACLFHIHQAGEGPALVTFPREAGSVEEIGPRDDCCAVLMPMRSHRTGADGAFDTAAFLNN